MASKQPDDRGDVILYQTEDGRTALDVRLAGETVWLTLNQMADLFGRDKSVVSRHLRNIFVTKELSKKATVAKNATTAAMTRYSQPGWTICACGTRPSGMSCSGSTRF